MISITKCLETINDTLNPIVVKELRQAVQGKFFSVILMVFLGVLLLTMGLFLTQGSVSWSFDAGRDIFSMLLGILLGTCLLFVPAYTGIRLASERSDANVDLLFITALRPRSIIWGKFLAALVLTVLLYSACMPFMTFTYLLRGVDLPSIFILLALTFILAAVGIQCAIFLGCIPANRVFRLIIGVAWLVFLVVTVIPAFIALMIFPGALFSSGIGSQIGSWEFWRGALSVLFSGLTLISLLALLAIALISPLSANRALPLRIFVTGVWLLTGVGVAIWSIAINNIDPVAAWGSLHVLLYSIGLFIAVNERERLGQRVRQSIPRRRWLRLLAFLFYSGAAGGVVWSSLMIVLTLSSIVVWGILFPHMWSGGTTLNGFMGVMIVMGLYAFSYPLGASLIRRRFLANRVAGGYTWVIAIVLLGFTTMIIPLILFFASGTWEREWLIGSPVGVTFAFNVTDIHVLVFNSLKIASVCAVLVGVLSVPWFVRQIRNFQPPKQNTANESQTDEA
jgi:hypothetical protein